MSNVVRTESQLLSDFLDNTIRLITPQMVRDFVVSAFGWPATVPPTANDDNVNTGGTGQFFDVGSRWNDTSHNKVYICVDGTPATAVWLLLNGSGGPPTGSAGGDLSGTYPNPTVAKINGTSVPSAPTVGQILKATGSTSATWQTPSGSPITTRQTVLGSTTTLSAGIGSWGNSLCSVTVPATGTWLMVAQVRGYLNVTAGTTPQINARLRNDVAGATVTDSEFLVVEATNLGLDAQNTAMNFVIGALNFNDRIVIESKYDYATVFAAKQIVSDSDGKTSLTLLQLA